jgi:broad specificity phosphatase PhoE
MRLILVRHAKTLNNEKNIIQIDDAPLSTQGEEEAKAVSERLKNEKIDIAYSSPYLRCKQTATEILNLHPHVPLTSISELREREHGIYCGRPKKELVAARAAEQKEFGTWKAPDGESDIDLRTRTKHFLNQLSEKHSSETILIVSHGSTIVHLLLHIKNLPLSVKTYDPHMHDNTGVTIVTLDEGVTFETLACTKHLE